MRVELHDIHKHFGAVHANNGISLSVKAGTIQGILGENGAGKSTLMKILSGFLRPDSGTIELDGTAVRMASPADAIRHGVGMLHQDPLDFPPMSVLDDFVLGSPGGLFPDRSAARRALGELSTRFGFTLPPESPVDGLTVGERQQLEIVRLLWLGARVLILDEPTTGISRPQKESLFATLKRLSADGMTIIFVSHKLEDVEYLCDRIAVFRAGALSGESAPPYETKRLVDLMFGRPIANGSERRFGTGEPVLHLRALSLKDSRLSIPDVDLEVRSGEVIGLAGMEGSGQSTLLAACAGLVRPVSGVIQIIGRNMTRKSHHAFKRLGVAYLPAARLEQALVPGLTLAEHFVLAGDERSFFLNPRAAAERARKRLESYAVKGTPASRVESLSGGNQQRMLLALLGPALSLVLLEHPTRGLDLESTLYIWSLLKKRCEDGASIVFISADLDELLSHSDRVVVFFAGRVSRPLQTSELTVDRLGEMIGGKGWEPLDRERVHA